MIKQIAKTGIAGIALAVIGTSCVQAPAQPAEDTEYAALELLDRHGDTVAPRWIWEGGQPIIESFKVSEPRADITEIFFANDPTELMLSLKVAQPTALPSGVDLNTAPWVGPTWYIETTGANKKTFLVETFVSLDGPPLASVRQGDQDQCNGQTVQTGYEGRIDIFIDVADCLGSSETFRVRASSGFHNGTERVGDSAPDVGFSMPVHPLEPTVPDN